MPPLHRLVTSRGLKDIFSQHLWGGGGGGGGGEGIDPMVADHWFRQIENILKAIEITSDVIKIRLTAFQLEGESQVWWDWIKTSRNLEAMIWGEF